MGLMVLLSPVTRIRWAETCVSSAYTPVWSPIEIASASEPTRQPAGAIGVTQS